MNPSPHGPEGKTGEGILKERINRLQKILTDDENSFPLTREAKTIELKDKLQIKALREALERIRIEPDLDKIYWYSQKALAESDLILKDSQ